VVVAIMMMVIGVAVALLWRKMGYHALIYEGLPSMLIALILGATFSQKVYKKNL